MPLELPHARLRIDRAEYGRKAVALGNDALTVDRFNQRQGMRKTRGFDHDPLETGNAALEPCPIQILQGSRKITTHVAAYAPPRDHHGCGGGKTTHQTLIDPDRADLVDEKRRIDEHGRCGLIERQPIRAGGGLPERTGQQGGLATPQEPGEDHHRDARVGWPGCFRAQTGSRMRRAAGMLTCAPRT